MSDAVAQGDPRRPHGRFRATAGEEIVVAAGVPFGHPGTTNALRVAALR